MKYKKALEQIRDILDNMAYVVNDRFAFELDKIEDIVEEALDLGDTSVP